MNSCRLPRPAAVALVGAAVTVCCGSVAYAALASLQPATAGAASASVPHCDDNPSGWTISFTESGSNVTAFTVNGISSNCNGKTLNWALRMGTSAPIASGAATISGGAASVSLSPAKAYNSFDHEDFVILG